MIIFETLKRTTVKTRWIAAVILSVLVVSLTFGINALIVSRKFSSLAEKTITKIDRVHLDTALCSGDARMDVELQWFNPESLDFEISDATIDVINDEKNVVASIADVPTFRIAIKGWNVVKLEQLQLKVNGQNLVNGIGKDHSLTSVIRFALNSGSFWIPVKLSREISKKFDVQDGGNLVTLDRAAVMGTNEGIRIDLSANVTGFTWSAPKMNITLAKKDAHLASLIVDEHLNSSDPILRSSLILSNRDEANLVNVLETLRDAGDAELVISSTSECSNNLIKDFSADFKISNRVPDVSNATSVRAVEVRGLSKQGENGISADLKFLILLSDTVFVPLAGRIPEFSLKGSMASSTGNVSNEAFTVGIESSPLDESTLTLKALLNVELGTTLSFFDSILSSSMINNIDSVVLKGERGKGLISSYFHVFPLTFNLPEADGVSPMMNLLSHVEFSSQVTTDSFWIDVRSSWNDTTIPCSDGTRLEWDHINSNSSFDDDVAPFSVLAMIEPGFLIFHDNSFPVGHINCHVEFNISTLADTSLIYFFEEYEHSSPVRSLSSLATKIGGNQLKQFIGVTGQENHPILPANQSVIEIKRLVKKTMHICSLPDSEYRLEQLLLNERNLICSLFSDINVLEKIVNLLEMPSAVKEFIPTIKYYIGKYKEKLKQIPAWLNLLLDYPVDSLPRRILRNSMNWVIKFVIERAHELKVQKLISTEKFLGENGLDKMSGFPKPFVPVIKNFTARYFDEIHYSIKLDMLAAYLTAPANATNSELLVRVLSYAGPFIQKLLQMLGDGVKDKELNLLLESMKSSIPMMDDDDLEHQKLNAFGSIENFNKRFVKFEKTKKAASVGQGFMAIFIADNGKPYNAFVKVLRPNLLQKMIKEFELLRDCSTVDTIGPIEEMIKSYLMELDFRIEMKYGEIGKKVYVKSNMIESVNYIAAFQSLENAEESVMLIMEQVKGKPLSDLSSNSGNPCFYVNSISALLRMWFEEAMYGSGFFHGDPQAGNVMSDSHVLTVIDYGNANYLPPSFRRNYINIGIGIMNRIPKYVMYSLGRNAENAHLSEWNDMEQALTTLFNSAHFESLDSDGQFDIAIQVVSDYATLPFPPKSMEFFRAKMLLENQLRKVAKIFGDETLKELKCPVPKLFSVYYSSTISNWYNIVPDIARVGFGYMISK